MLIRVQPGRLVLRGILLAASVAGATVGVSREGRSQGLLSSATTRPFRLPPVDPSLPKGRERNLPEPVASPGVTACSFEFSLCVHEGTSGGTGVLETLRALEIAYARAVVVLNLPPPRRAPVGSGARVTALLEGGPRPMQGDAVVVRELPIELGAFDSAGSVCHVRQGLRGLTLERAAAICVGEAIALGLDPGMTSHLQRAYATHLWWATGGQTAEDWAALEAFQAFPEGATFGAERSQASEGAALVFEFLEGEGTVNRTRAGEFATALVARAGGRTEPAANEWNNEPDVVDVLQRSFVQIGRPWASLLGDFAVARGLLGLDAVSWSPFGRHWTGGLCWLPHCGLRFDWRIPLSSLPRRLQTRHPIEPTGSTFVWVDVDAPLGEDTTLGMRAECEAPVAFEWEVVKLEGQELTPNRVPIAFQGQTQVVERTLSGLQHTRALLVAGTNVGGVRASYPFDPDVVPYEPHACTIYLTRM